MKAAKVLRSRLVLVGPGRAGSAFARSWLKAGGRLHRVLGRDLPSAKRAARRFGQGAPLAVSGASFDCDVLILAVADDAIESVAAELARGVNSRVAFHFSGARPAALLAPFAERGCAVGSLHPLKAFRGTASESWRGAFVAIEGDRLAVEIGLKIVAAVGARGQSIAPEGKPLYHAAATLAAGGCLALVSLAVRAWTSLGLPETEARAALAGLGSQALSALGRQEFENAFTGPIARRDVATVRAHWAALAKFPGALAVYALLADETLVRTPGRGREQEIRAVLEAGESEAAALDPL